MKGIKLGDELIMSDLVVQEQKRWIQRGCECVAGHWAMILLVSVSLSRQTVKLLLMSAE